VFFGELEEFFGRHAKVPPHRRCMLSVTLQPDLGAAELDAAESYLRGTYTASQKIWRRAHMTYNVTIRRARRACEGAARGAGPPQATEPGCGTEPHVSSI
jgi:hypothetical protein